MKKIRKYFCILMMFIMVAGFTAAEGQKDESGKPVVIKMGDNLPDRSNGLGAVAETVNQEFIRLHPEVSFEVESYQDQAYQQKIKIYATAGQLPDVMKYWSFSTLLQPLVESKLVEPLDRNAVKDLPWLPGALEGNVYDGELYGIPTSADLWVVFYNEAIFDEVGVEIPATFAGMKAAAAKLSAAGYIPAVTDGKDGWPLSISYDNILWRVTGDYSVMEEALAGKKSFTDPEFLKAAELYQEVFHSSGIFRNDLVTTDYGAARNLFGQEQAAMYIMGAWELGMASDPNFSERFRSNVHATRFPVLRGGEDQRDNLVAWYGGNYIVKADSKHKDLAMEYIKLYSEIYADVMWDLQAGFPAQAIQPSDKDNDLAKDLLQIAGEAKETSGTTSLDRLDAAFKEAHQKLCKDLAAGVITPEQFCKDMDVALKKALK